MDVDSVSFVDGLCMKIRMATLRVWYLNAK